MVLNETNNISFIAVRAARAIVLLFQESSSFERIRCDHAPEAIIARFCA